MIWIYFDVLILDAFFLECDPNALNERAEPATIQLQRLLSRMRLKPSVLLRVGKRHNNNNEGLPSQ